MTAVALNQKWAVWIRDSFAAYLAPLVAAGTLPAKFIIEGADRPKQDENWYELRTDGPVFEQQTAEFWMADWTVNVVCNAYISDQLYDWDQLAGQMASWLAGTWQLKDDTTPTPIVLDCPKRIGKIIVRPFGQVDVAKKLLQATVQATYQIMLP